MRIACKCEDWPQVLHNYPGKHLNTSHNVKAHLKKVTKKPQKLYQSDPKNACSSIVTSVFFFVAFLYSSTVASLTLCLMKGNNNIIYFSYHVPPLILFLSYSYFVTVWLDYHEPVQFKTVFNNAV